MWWKNSPEDDAIQAAMGRGLALVPIPGMTFVFGLISFGGMLHYVFCSRNSEAVPALKQAYAPKAVGSLT